MDNVTVAKLKKLHGEKAEEVFSEIAHLGGFGEYTRDHTGGIDPNYAGGLDLKGVLDDNNKDVPASAKDRIRELIKEKKEK